MDIKDIDDVVFSAVDNSYRNQEINFNFIYNNYIENETMVDDNIILNRDVESKNRFVRIAFENNVEAALAGSFSEYDNIKKNILYVFNDKDLYESDREFFNKQDDLFPGRKTLVFDNKIEDFSNYNKFYNAVDGNTTEIDFLFNDRSNLLSITHNRNYEDNLLKKDYPENFNFNNTQNYLDLVSSERIENKRKKNNLIESFKTGALLPELNYISESINLGDVNEYANLNAIFCGAYIEKFLLVNDKYEFLCSRFYMRPEIKSNRIVSKIEDEAVKYGSTYRYISYNVYFYTTVNPVNRFVLRHYLLCTHPYMSNDIICKEKNPPPPPVSLTMTYNLQNKVMLLRWEEPTNYEGDVKGYQILKRNSIEEPYKIVKQIEGHLITDLYEPDEVVPAIDIIKKPGKIDKKYFDEDFDENKMCIYTIRSIDAHGMKSDYGEQIGVYYDFLRNKLITSLIAKPGANVSYPNRTLLNKSIFHENIPDFVDNLPIINKPRKISLYLTPDFAYIRSNEILRKTLDDDYQFTLTNLNDFVHKTDKFSIVNFR